MLEPPSSEFWLGTDDKGRSVLTLLIWGARISLFVGLAATADLDGASAPLIGLMSGYFGGWPGAILFRLTEWFLVIPFLPLAIVMATVLGRSLFNIVHRDRRDLVARHRAADPQPDADDPGAALPRARPRARRRARATRSAGTSCPT